MSVTQLQLLKTLPYLGVLVSGLTTFMFPHQINPPKRTAALLA